MSVTNPKPAHIPRYLPSQTKNLDFTVVFCEIDPVQHAFWKYADGMHTPRASESLQSVIEDYYVNIDQRIGEILGEVADAANVIVISDHDGRSLTKWIQLRRVHMPSGYVKCKRELPTLLKLTCFKLGPTPLTAYVSGKDRSGERAKKQEACAGPYPVTETVSFH